MLSLAAWLRMSAYPLNSYREADAYGRILFLDARRRKQTLRMGFVLLDPPYFDSRQFKGLCLMHPLTRHGAFVDA